MCKGPAVFIDNIKIVVSTFQLLFFNLILLYIFLIWPKQKIYIFLICQDIKCVRIDPGLHFETVLIYAIISFSNSPSPSPIIVLIFIRFSFVGLDDMCVYPQQYIDFVKHILWCKLVLPILFSQAAFSIWLKPMKGKVFFGQNLIWVMLLLGQLHGYESCIQKERMSLLDLKKYLISTTQEGQSEVVFPTWTNDTTSDCCRWEAVHCNPRNKRITEISIHQMFVSENSLLNLSLLHPFEELRSLNLSECSLTGFFDDMEGIRGFYSV